MALKNDFSWWNSNLGHREREALNEASLALELQGITDTNQSKSLSKLFALDRAQAEEITHLRALVSVMAEMLVEQNVLSGDVLKMRLKDSLRELEEARRPKINTDSKGGHPYRGSGIPSEPSAPEAVTNCSRCTKEVLTRNTQITGEGVVCDGCYYG
tara:strand:+ start:36196 stop:36666 length:471 start_codon:yes stop_codon:yes gene_type:complete